MSEPLGLMAEQQAFTAVCTQLASMMEPGDERIDYTVSMTAPVETTTVMAINPAGRYNTPAARRTHRWRLMSFEPP